MLLSRPESYKDESALGYLLRLAEANGFRHPRYLLYIASALEIKGTLHAYVDWLHDNDDRPSSLIGVPAAHIVSRSKIAEHSLIRMRYLAADKARYCPECLNEAMYWRVAWEHAFCVHCHRHKVWLVNTCKECGSQIPSWRHALNQCSCGAKLDSQGAEKIPVGKNIGIALSNELLAREGVFLPLELEHDSKVIPKELQHLSSMELHRLLFLLGSYASSPSLLKPRKKALKIDTRHACRLLTAAAGLIEDWPAGFHRYLVDQMKRSSGNKGLSKRFGFLYTAIYREFGGAEFAFLKNGFESFLQENWNEVISGRNRRLSEWIKQSQGYVPASVVVRLFDVPRHALRKGIEDGYISGVITPLPSGRERIVVAKTELSKVPELWNWADLKTSAQVLGLPERRVIELVSDDMLEGQAPAAGESWKIKRGGLTTLLARLAGSALATVVTSQGMVLMGKVLRHHLKPGDSFSGLVRALLDGRISYEWRSQNAGMAGIWLDKQELKMWLQPDDERVGVPQLARLLGIKQEVAYHLVRRQLINADAHAGRGQLVSLDEIQRFRTEYVLARDLAQMLRTSPRSLIHRLGVAGLVPVTGPGVDECRQVIYRREALEAVPLSASIRRSLDQLGRGNLAASSVGTKLVSQVSGNHALFGKSE